MVQIQNSIFCSILNCTAIVTNISIVELKTDLDKIEIFKPIESKEIIEDSISFNGNGNSFLEVNELVFNEDSNKYNEFVMLVKKLK